MAGSRKEFAGGEEKGTLRGNPERGGSHYDAPSHDSDQKNPAHDARHPPERALGESEERFRLLVESIKDYAIFELDAQGHVLSWNRGAERIKGYRPEEIIGKHFSVFYTPEDIREGRPERGLQEAAAKGRYEDEGWRVRKDGSQFWADAVITALRDEAGNLRGFAKITRDLTEHRQKDLEMAKAKEQLEVRVHERTSELEKADQSLQAEIAEHKLSEAARQELFQDRDTLLALLEVVLDRSPIGCVMNDVDYRVTYWNPAAERIFGFTREEVAGKLPYETFVPPGARPYFDGIRERVAHGDLGAHAASEHVTKDGRTIYCEWYNTPLRDSSGAFIGFLSMVQDFTARKRAEEHQKAFSNQLRALAARLQNVREDERTRVAREIHDELGQACTALKMDLALLVKQLPRNKKRLHERSESMLRLIDGMIHSLRRIASELRPSTLDDLGLTAALEWQAQEFERRSGVRCEVALPAEELALDSARATAVFRIFQETLTNVARHANATRVDVRMVSDAESLVLEVSDNGRGIEETHASSPRSLGLLGMRERALLLGGEFQIMGAPRKGTTVTLRLPLTKRGAGGPQTPDAAPESPLG